MKKIFAVVTLLATAGSSQAGSAIMVDEDTFFRVAGSPAFKQAISKPSLQALRITAKKLPRNHHYSIDLLRSKVQRQLSRERSKLEQGQRVPDTSADRELIHHQTEEFLEELSFEVDRLAKESKDSKEFKLSLDGLSDQIEGWAGSSAVEVSAQAADTGKFLPTEDNIEGPFYRPNAPWTLRLNAPQDKGESFVISGRVLSTDGTPLAEAVLDIWQADAQGAYDIDHPRDRNNPNIPLRFRGRIKTDARGNFRFESILPGQYEIGENKWRPKHVHFKVSATGHKLLTTQLYFEGDRFNTVDPWWKPSLTVTLKRQEGVFDFVLRRETAN